MPPSSLLLLAPLLWALPRAPLVRAQSTDAVCSPDFSWMNNEQAQSPCLVAAVMQGLCSLDHQWNVSALPSGLEYLPPTAEEASFCNCNALTYSLMSACAACQQHNWVSYGDWIASCPSSLVTPTSPFLPPDNTSIPPWAPTSYASLSSFDVNKAKSIALGQPVEDSKKTPVSAIVGAVLGVVFGFMILGGGFAYYVYRRRKKQNQSQSLWNSKLGDQDTAYVEFDQPLHHQRRFFRFVIPQNMQTQGISSTGTTYTIDDAERLKGENFVMYDEVDSGPDSPGSSESATSSAGLAHEANLAPPTMYASSLGSLSRHAETGRSVDSEDEGEGEDEDEMRDLQGPVSGVDGPSQVLYIHPSRSLRNPGRKDKLSPAVDGESFGYQQPVRATRSMSTLRPRLTADRESQELGYPRPPGIQSPQNQNQPQHSPSQRPLTGSPGVSGSGNGNNSSMSPQHGTTRSEWSLPLTHPHPHPHLSSDRSRVNPIEYITPPTTAPTMLFPASVRGAGYRGTPEQPF
ncbi:hypothetical protein BOTBODRAFT_256568 [Botryobasidium botryosum FD-172 SS1]|uniref:Uncharacterized protein n=1 Tax=Botryobasidium botryosum (strain FD-172 SS1) TaxID=930990 RepID=A0A067MKV6_BOTB1|nr:hypothetical protein BOTBODRAFT_256568 [Botryobasidium botryosum FD-172 SS1]